jgi:hypothetical protein
LKFCNSSLDLTVLKSKVLKKIDTEEDIRPSDWTVFKAHWKV